MLLPHTREILAVRPKPRGFYRILVLGDSMVRGHGVVPREALPAHLERILNRSVWDRRCEVVNCGQDGRSLYEMCSMFATRGLEYAPDLVVLVLCDNDALLFRDSRTYRDQVRASWRDETRVLPYFEWAFGHFTRELRMLGVPLELAFYYQRDNEVRHRALEVLGRLCRQHRLGFVDLSEPFRRSAVEKAWDLYRASPVDPHPSSYSHQIAARALARHLVSAGHLSTEATRDEASVLAECIRQSADALEAGVPAAWELPRLVDTLEDKRRCNERLPPQHRLPDGELRRRTTDARRSAAAGRRLLGLQGLLHHLDERAGALSRELESLDRISHLLDGKDFLHLEAQAADPTLRYWPRAEEADPDLDLGRVPHRLASWESDLQESLALLERIGALPATDLPGDAPWSERLTLDQRRVAARLELYQAPVREIFSAFLRLIERARKLLDRSEDSVDPRQSRRHLLFVLDGLLDAESRCREVREMFSDETGSSMAEEDRPSSAWTTVLVTARSVHTQDRGRALEVRLDSLVPTYSVSDQRHMILDGGRHTYVFEFPATGRTVLGLILPEPQAALERVEVGSPGIRMSSLPAERLERREPGVYASPPILVPI